ncbi:helix-turn-helix domain-containing protein [Methanoculleus sp. MH98A]|nr:helix-turn-helix domain-containing protein [Methanoculleus sp. MH98A]HQD25416.1 helix-turn-helix domain-containing protein [Methanoculleus thermophilus]
MSCSRRNATGYYEYPRRINSQQFAEKPGIGKTTALLAGY